jgi:hypothetical protein
VQSVTYEQIRPSATFTKTSPKEFQISGSGMKYLDLSNCQHFEIGGLPFHLALFSLRNFHAVAVFSHLL